MEVSYNGGVTYEQIVLLQTLKGPAGERGLTGLTGAKGDKGDKSTITIGQVTASDPGAPADVVNVGTQTDAILDITLPRGEVGPAPDVDFRFNAGFLEVAANEQIANDDYKPILPESKLTGPSAYQIATAYGETRTEPEWLLSLVGPRGLKGETGDSLKVLGSYEQESQLPASAESGDAYLIERNL
jgi:hypothetical protein